MDSEKRDVAVVVGGLLADVASLFSMPAGMAQSLLGQYVSRKAVEARDVLMDELRKGEISDFEAAAADEVVGTIYSYLLAARDNAARFNLRLFAKALVGQLRRHRLYADEFQRWKDVLSRITPDQALVLGRFIHITKEIRREIADEDKVAAKARTMLKAELVPEAFDSEDYMNAVCAQAASLGLLLLRTGFGSTLTLLANSTSAITVRERRLLRRYPQGRGSIMSLKPQSIPPVPDQTAAVARAAFPKGNAVLRLRDELGTIYQDDLFAALYPQRGQPAVAPWRLALVSVLQFLEGLPDRQAADAVRGRIDWKYALSLDLTDPGFDFSVLSEFRARLIAGEQETLLLDALLTRLKKAGLVKAGGRQRTDSTHVLAAIRGLNRLETIGETLRAALNSLAEAAPAWLTERITLDWFNRYGRRVEEYRLPKGEAARTALAEQIGRDGHQILAAVYAADAPIGLRALPTVQALRRTWVHQFYTEEDQVHWRTATELPPASQRHDSPYDVEAHYGNKRSATWVGYKVHLSETCDAQAPHLITHVETTLAPVSDIDRTAPIHAALAARGLAPAVHFLDAGYVDAPLLIASRAEQRIEIVGPVRPDISWQSKTHQGYDLSAFTIDWDARTVTCPQDQTATSWVPKTDHWGNAVVHVKFPFRACTPCPARAHCTQAKASPRNLTFRPRAEHEALQDARRHQETEEWRRRYAARAGVEGTLAQALQLFDLRRCRYLGLAKTHLQHILTAVALNIVRLDAWWTDRPLAKTRISRFAALQQAVA